MSEFRKEWYVVNTYSGHEKKVMTNLVKRSESMGMTDYIFRVIVPERIEKEYKDGEVQLKEKKLFPGYVLVEMIMTDESWYVVRNTPGVTGFIGSSGGGAKPIPLFLDEVKHILDSMGMEMDLDDEETIITDVDQITTDEVVVNEETSSPSAVVVEKTSEFNVGDIVELTDGAFAGMNGEVTSVNLDEERLEVAVDLFGLLTPIEIEIFSVKKVDKE